MMVLFQFLPFSYHFNFELVLLLDWNKCKSLFWKCDFLIPADEFTQKRACSNNRQERAHLIAVYLSVSDISNSTPPLLYLLLCLITAVSLQSSTVFYHINARFKCDEMLILVVEAQLRTLLFQLANG